MFHQQFASQGKINFWLIISPITESSKTNIDITGKTTSATNNNEKNIIESIDITELIDSKYELIKPINANIIRDGLDYIGEIPELKIYAFGDSYLETLREINKDITELFEELDNLNKEQLGKDPTKWKEILSHYVKKISD